MKAKIRRDGDVTIVSLVGRLDFETAEPFRETCEDALMNSKVVFNLSDLNFVGSSGIGSFVNTLREFSTRNPVKPRFCGVKSEFQKIFRTTMDAQYHLYMSENDALRSFFDPEVRSINLDFIEKSAADDDDDGVGPGEI